MKRYELYEKYIGTGESIADTRLAQDGDWVAYADYKQALAEKDKAYQQLMEQAIEFAKCLTGCPSPCTEADWPECRMRRAEAFLKEREHDSKG